MRVMRRRDLKPILHCITQSRHAGQQPIFLRNMLDTGQASVFDVDENGWTIIHWAVLVNDGPAVRLLLSYGADLHLSNDIIKFQISPFITACLSW